MQDTLTKVLLPKKEPKPVYETEEEFWAALKHDGKVGHDFDLRQGGRYAEWSIGEKCFDIENMPGNIADAAGLREQDELATVRISIEIVDPAHDPWSGEPSVDYD